MFKCKTCGGANFIKENGEYRCLDCNMTYTLDEIKKACGHN